MTRKKILIGLALTAAMAVGGWMFYPTSMVDRGVYERIHKGMNQQDAERMLPARWRVEMSRGYRLVAAEPNTVFDGRPVESKNFPDWSSESYDKETGKLLAKHAYYPGGEWFIEIVYDADGKVNGKYLYEFTGPPFTWRDRLWVRIASFWLECFSR